MAAVTSLALTAAGVGLSVYSANKQAKAQSRYAQEQAAAASQAEALRRQQMELDARRRQREVVRQSQRARSMALSTATVKNAQGGSGLMGGFGQIQGQTGTNALGISQNLELGRSIFDTNAALTQSSIRYAGQAGRYGQMAGIGGGLMSLGGAMISNLGAIDRLGQYYGSQGNDYGITEGMASGYDPWAGYR